MLLLTSCNTFCLLVIGTLGCAQNLILEGLGELIWSAWAWQDKHLTSAISLAPLPLFLVKDSIN